MSQSIAVVCGTNRKDAISLSIATMYYDLLSVSGMKATIVDLNMLPPDFAFSSLYENYGKNTEFNTFASIMLKSQKFVFVVPEYNGSFPGALKTFIDGLEYPNTFRGKKGGLVGLASSGHGASLALSHLTDILNFCGTNVLAYKPRLERIEDYFVDSVLTNEKYKSMLSRQAKMLIEF